MPLVVLPDPCLVVLVGPAGAGKSSFAARHFAADEILASDALRELVAGDEADQRASRPAFAILHRRLAQRLADGRLTVVDATNVEPDARHALLRRSRLTRRPAVAIVVDLPDHVVLARNAGRSGRTVDPAVVRHHLARLRRTIESGLLEREAFDAVYRFREPAQLDAVVIRRVPAGS